MTGQLTCLFANIFCNGHRLSKWVSFRSHNKWYLTKGRPASWNNINYSFNLLRIINTRNEICVLQKGDRFPRAKILPSSPLQNMHQIYCHGIVIESWKQQRHKTKSQFKSNWAFTSRLGHPNKMFPLPSPDLPNFLEK